MPIKPKQQREKKQKKRPMNFRVDDITVYRTKVLAAYYRNGLTNVVENLIDLEFERLEKKDPVEMKKAKSFVK